MRCKFCGSKAIYPYTQHEQATAGRVVAGAIIAGAIGAAAGLAGKNVKGYRCSACGMFSEQPMDFGEEMLINSAVSDAKNGKTVIYERYQEKYANLEFVPVRQVVKQESALLPDEDYDEDDVELLPEAEPVDASIKHSYCPNQYVVGSPVFISNVTIKDDSGTDVLLLEVNNISGKTLRSVYLNITVYDDVGDQISTSTFAFQGLSAATGEQLPQAKPFNLNTNVAYKVDVICEKAAFTDDTVWRKEENPTIYSVPEKTELVPESFAQHKYLRVLLAKKGALRVGQKLYYPVVEETHRLCVCGNPAVSGSKCLACGLSEADLQEVMDYDVLVQCRKDVIVKTARERTEALHELCMQVQEDQYQKAIHLKDEDTQASCAAAIEIFTSMSGYKDADSLCVICKERLEELNVKAEIARKDGIYAAGKAKMSNRSARIEHFESAIAEFKKIPGWKDADEQIVICQKKIEELKAQEEADRKERERKDEIARAEAAAAAKRKKVTIAIVAVAVCVAIAFLVVLNTIIIPNGKYNDAIALMESGNYSEAISAFEALDGYKDSGNKIQECNTAITDIKYSDAIALMDAGKYDEAMSALEALDGYKDSVNKIIECQYLLAQFYVANSNYTAAHQCLQKISSVDEFNDRVKQLYDQIIDGCRKAESYDLAISIYKNANGFSIESEEYKNLVYEAGIAALTREEYLDAAVLFADISGYLDADTQYLEAQYQRGLSLMDSGSYEYAIKAFEQAKGYKDADTQIQEAKYQYVMANRSRTNTTTYTYLKDLKTAKYKDSVAIFNEMYAWKAEIIANTEKDDYTTSKNALLGWSPIFFHIRLSGGEPGAETILTAKTYFPNGKSSTYTFDGAWSDGEYGWTGWEDGLYTSGSYKGGTMKIEIYDGNGNKIGEHSITLISIS